MLCIREEEMRGQATASGSCSINARARVSGGGHIQGPRDGRCAVMRVYGLELRIRLHAPTTRQARLLYPLKSYRLAPLIAKIIIPSLIQSHRPAGHLQHPAMLCVSCLVSCSRLHTSMRWSCCA